MARSTAALESDVDRGDAEEVLRLAGVPKLKANSSLSRKYIEKVDQLVAFKMTQQETKRLRELPGEILTFFYGVVTQSNRKALFEGMRGDFDRACAALQHLNRGDLLSELNRLCGFVVEKSTWEQSKMWREIGLELTAGTEDDPLVFIGRHGHLTMRPITANERCHACESPQPSCVWTQFFNVNIPTYRGINEYR